MASIEAGLNAISSRSIPLAVQGLALGDRSFGRSNQEAQVEIRVSTKARMWTTIGIASIASAMTALAIGWLPSLVILSLVAGLAWFLARGRSISASHTGITVQDPKRSAEYGWSQIVDYGFTTTEITGARVLLGFLGGPLIGGTKKQTHEVLYLGDTAPEVLPADLDTHRSGFRDHLIDQVAPKAGERALFVLRSGGHLDAGAVSVHPVDGLRLKLRIGIRAVEADELHTLEYEVKRKKLQVRRQGDRSWRSVRLADVTRLASLVGLLDILRSNPAALTSRPTSSDIRAFVASDTADLADGLVLPRARWIELKRDYPRLTEPSPVGTSNLVAHSSNHGWMLLAIIFIVWGGTALAIGSIVWGIPLLVAFLASAWAGSGRGVRLERHGVVIRALRGSVEYPWAEISDYTQKPKGVATSGSIQPGRSGLVLIDGSEIPFPKNLHLRPVELIRALIDTIKFSASTSAIEGLRAGGSAAFGAITIDRRGLSLNGHGTDRTVPLDQVAHVSYTIDNTGIHLALDLGGYPKWISYEVIENPAALVGVLDAIGVWGPSAFNREQDQLPAA